MNSYAILENCLSKVKQNNEDPWRIKNDDTDGHSSECGWTLSEVPTSRRNSQLSTVSAHSWQSGETLLNMSGICDKIIVGYCSYCTSSGTNIV